MSQRVRLRLKGFDILALFRMLMEMGSRLMKATNNKNRGLHAAVFLDRDGTLNEDPGFISRPDELILFPGVVEAVRSLQESGYLVVVVTNQSGIARGYFTEGDLKAVHRKLRDEIVAGGGSLDGIYHCPHHPIAGEGVLTRSCSCRKPAPGMIYEASKDLKIDLKRSFMVGDKLEDLEAGRCAGCRTVLVRTGLGEEALKEVNRKGGPQPDKVVMTLQNAVRWIRGQGIEDIED